MKFLLLDRDGTVIRDPGSPLMQVQPDDILPGAIEGLAMFRDAGYRFFIITNQSGIGKGDYTEAEFLESQRQLMEILEQAGVAAEGFEYCPHNPDLLCSCRKPEIGMWDRLTGRFPDLKEGEGFMVGDRDKDVIFGKRIGAKTARIDSGQYPCEEKADYTVKDLRELASLVLPS